MTKLPKRGSRPTVRKNIAILALGAASVMSLNSHAVNTDANAVFTGTILDTCTVSVTAPGLLGVNNEQTRLASDELGGVAAAASIVTNSNRSSIQVLAPVAFETAPLGSDVNTEFSTSYTLTGTTTAEEDDGATLTSLELGASAMTITAAAEKTNGNFNGGEYTFVTTVRCITP